MPKLNVPPTKSSLLILRQQLAFTREGYDLLEQKRQILIFELMSRLDRAHRTEFKVAQALARAFAALREAVLEVGTKGLDQAALAVQMDHQVDLLDQHLMGLRLPHLKATIKPVTPQFGVGGTSAHTDQAMRRFVELLPQLAELAELENAIMRLARELRKTQRRCNALSKIFIPNCEETIGYITSTLEERERESFIILKMIRDRLAAAANKKCPPTEKQESLAPRVSARRDGSVDS